MEAVSEGFWAEVLPRLSRVLRGTRSSFWLWWLTVGGAVVVLYLTLPGSIAADAVYLVGSLSAPVSVGLGIRWFRPVPRAPWFWLGSAVTLLFAADVAWFVLDAMGMSPYPSVADVLFLAAYPCLAVGLALLVGYRTATREVSSLLDAAIVSIGVGVVTWVLVIGPLLADVDSTPMERVVAAAYPVLDVLLLAVVARLAFSGGTRNGALVLLTLGMLTNLVADVAYVFMELTGSYVEYGLLDGSWLLAYVLIGGAALHPSMTRLAMRVRESPVQVTPLRLAVLTVASVTAPSILLVQWLRGAPLEVPIVAVGAIAMFVLVVARVSELGRLVAVTRARGEARFRSLVHNATDVIIVLDADATITYASPAINRVWHHRTAEVIGTPFTSLLHPDDTDRFTHTLTLSSDTTDTTAFSGRIWSPAQHWRTFEARTANLLADPSVNGIVLTCRDITERVRLEAELTHQAFHDPLTGLANRALFLDRVDHALGRLTRNDHPDRLVAVLFIDLDDFKTVNDALGHTAGDTLLIAAADRLATHLRPGDTAARLGGDEFAVLVEDATDHATITAVAERLITALTAPYTIAGTTVSINASIGIAARDTPGSAQLLIRDADIAMYDAKAHGKGRHAWFTPPMRIQALHRWQLRTDLTTAVADNQLFVEYQPIIELATGRIAGAEALIRWHHPTRGTIPPGEFIPIAEQTGLITDIGDWILHAATTHAATWQPPTHPSYISVNLSPVQLRDHTLLTRVQHALTTAGLPPAALMLELTESTLMHDIDQARATLAELKHLGIRIAIDDFGTGYSSLAYLHQLPVDILKIDRSFVNELNTPTPTHTLAHDIIALAHALNLTTIAEGIETPQQRSHLQTIGCTHGQGYHLGRPMPQHHLAERRGRRIGSLAYH